ncbi:MAG TPA: class C sortase [Candidatus Lachnoclostridium stercorigallinarum]|uniref:Class C sortase n=1 Tax=Candidatus Lachnoclostridium stercorigallinarum TaxID=2838634 RepID=A0A9D2K4W5_9FIRM|nr:class C sortase [Candidatus Lachnoclostridium stercorigallinarum]
MKKPRLVTVLVVLLFLVGAGVMLYPTMSDLYVRRQLQKELTQYNQVTQGEEADYSELWAAAEDYNRRLAEKENQFAVSEEEMKELSGLLNPLGTGMMGHIDIDKISVHLPVYQGTEEAALQAGAGWWIGTSMPTGGEGTHCVLTAHTGLVRAKMFTDLDQMEEGDTFSLTVLDRVLTYEVDQILITEPEEIEPLLIVDGEDYCTLYTCYPYGVNTERLLVRGHRIPTPEKEETVVSVLTESDNWMWAAAAGVAVILVIAAVIIIRHKKRRTAENEGKENPPQETDTENQMEKEEGNK